jgi:DNA-binding NarL/FixJ family response regulator
MSMKLLIVQQSQMQLTRLLGALGAVEGVCATLTESSLEQAFKTIQLEKPSLVIVDLHMHDANALRGIHRMKSLSPGVQIAGLVIEPSKFERNWCLNAGVDFVFDSAMDFDDLAATVQDMLRQ